MNEEEEVVVPAGRWRPGAKRTATRQRSLAPLATLAGMTGLAVTVVVTASAVLAVMINAYAAGVILGAGLMTVGWGVSRSRVWRTTRRTPVAGRSRTLDCHRSRWDRLMSLDRPAFPAPPTDHRAASCRKSRYHPGA
jgi:hypothetical protein